MSSRVWLITGYNIFLPFSSSFTTKYLQQSIYTTCAFWSINLFSFHKQSLHFIPSLHSTNVTSDKLRIFLCNKQTAIIKVKLRRSQNTSLPWRRDGVVRFFRCWKSLWNHFKPKFLGYSENTAFGNTHIIYIQYFMLFIRKLTYNVSLFITNP